MATTTTPAQPVKPADLVASPAPAPTTNWTMLFVLALIIYSLFDGE